jgi:UDP-glucose 4-epimerase
MGDINDNCINEYQQIVDLQHKIRLAESDSAPEALVNSYGIIKLAIEKYIQMFYALYDLPYSILRLSNPYGPEFSIEKPQGVIHHFVSKIIKNEAINVWGDGSVERDFIYIDDAISAILAAIYHDSCECLLNIGLGKSTSIKKVIDILEDVSGVCGNTSYERSRSCDLQKSSLNVDKAKLILGWEPKISLSEGIKLTYLDALTKS